MTEGLARIRARFLDELPNRLERINHLSALAGDGTSCGKDLMEIRRISHKIAGTAATLGFHELGRIAADVDDHLGGSAPVPDSPNRDQLHSIHRLIAAMGEVIRAGS